VDDLHDATHRHAGRLHPVAGTHPVYELKAVFPTPDLEGLRGTSSDEIVVRVSGGTTTNCTATCPNEEVDDPA